MNIHFDPTLFALVVIFGMIFGSFCTVLVYRIPREIPLGFSSHRKSLCPECNNPIPYTKNIPIIGFLLSRGKCVHCKKKIPLKYFLIEITTTLLFAITYLVLENSPNRLLDETAFYIDLAVNLYFCLALIATVFIDLEFRIIPDRFSLGGWVIAISAAFLTGEPLWWSALIGGIVGAGMFFIMAWSYEKFKGVEGLGMGDVKMMGWIGSWVGAFAVPFMILIASITGLIAGLIAMRKSGDGMKTAIPFGPFLALGAYVSFLLQRLELF